MRKAFTTLAILAAVVSWASPAHAQTFILSNTTLNGAMTATQQTVTLTSASASNGATVGAPALGQAIYVADFIPELMIITSVPTSGAVFGVRRAASTGSVAAAHVTGAVVLTGPAGNFYRTFPDSNVCVASSVPRPWVNVQTGDVGLCITSAWNWTNKKKITYDSVNPY